MRNIYDIRKLEELLFVLKYNSVLDRSVIFSKFNNCAIFVNLYYFDTVARYMDYLNQVPEDIYVYIYSSVQNVLIKAHQLQKRTNISYKIKKNRGRDISALLVEAKNELVKYEYICFLHDKRANANYLKKDTDIWIDNLWGNTIGSPEYIYEVITLFEKNKKIGLLVPPEAFGAYIPHWYGDNWLADFQNCKMLSQKLELHANISEDKDVFTIGTVFWTRTKALQKLFDQKWLYTDFPEEPMPIDGTISHAIEKILGYVAQDAGYQTGTIMSERYASWLLLSAQEYMRMMFARLQKREHIFNMAQLISLDQREQQIQNFCSQYKDIYIYGAGNYGQNLLHFVEDRGISVRGFTVSPSRKNQSEVEGYPVWEIQELDITKDTGILIGVSYEYRDEIEAIVRSYGIKNYLYGY